MKFNKLIIVLLLLMVVGINTLSAQEVASAAGGEVISNNGSISYSVGQMLYTNHSGSNGSVSHGVQQAYDISINTELENTEEIKLDYLVYPNPTKENLILKVGNLVIPDISYQLVDQNGKVIRSDEIRNAETLIDMTSLIPATYFLKIYNQQEGIKVFKIIKN